MESSIGEFPKIGKFPTLCSPDKSRKNFPALWTNSEIFQGESLCGEFVENVWYRDLKILKNIKFDPLWLSEIHKRSYQDEKKSGNFSI